jgi:threonine-phosphate decarboxylase
MGGLCHYPDRHTVELRQAIADRHGLSPKNVLVGNGSTALIRLLARAMDLKCIVFMAPAFGEFARSFAIAARHFHYLILKEANGFAPTRDDFEDLWDMEPACVVLTNPQTPSGALADPEALRAFLNKANLERCWVILDEAFVDFLPDQAARDMVPPLVAQHPRLIVLRSLTKFYCLAGLRLGYMLADEHTLGELAPLAEPWGVNTLAQAAGLHCLAQADYARQTLETVAKWRAQQAQGLKDLGLRLVPGQVNYLLVHLPEDGPNAQLVAAACADKGVLVRACGDFVGCSPWHLRVAVCPPEEQERLLAALKPALNMWLFGGSYK